MKIKIGKRKILKEVAYFDEEGEVDYKMRDDEASNLSAASTEGWVSDLGSTVVGDFIADHGSEEEALAYIEAMRQEIIDMMAEEDEEFKFAKDNPEYTTRTFEEDGEDV